MTLKDAVILVTGASGNVGQAVVKAFAEQGAKVALVDLKITPLRAFIKSLDGDKDQFEPFATDLSDPKALDELFQAIDDKFGTINHIVHTVGGFAMGDPVHAGNLDVFDHMMNLNARLLYLFGGKSAEYLLDKKIKGSISFMLARAGKKGGKNNAAYSASKSAATRIMESLSAELKEHGIRVNGVSPSIIDTPINREDMPNADFNQWVKPEQIGDLMVFLAQNSAMTGADIEINAQS
jgi:NAD(P)-dependent dehydrogenase (short-subunit alcohol dehydrogenase family)